MRRAKLPFADTEVEFADRELGLRRFEDWAERGTYPVQVIYGPEGCGKSALLRQGMEVLRDYGYSVALVSPLNSKPEDRLVLTEELRELAKDSLSVILGEPAAGLVDIATELLYRVVKANIKRKIALLLDDVFQAIGLDRAAPFVKSLLNMIEYPSIRYERIVVVVATSEGVTRREIGRHRWAEIMPMWNMPREGLKQLYDQLPGNKPSIEEVWRWTGGNPWILERLYRAGWDVDYVVDSIIKGKDLKLFIGSLNDEERRVLAKALEDPDVLFTRENIPLLLRLEELNLATDLFLRDPRDWLDVPPPERDLDLGVGEDVAWQTPLHREAVRRALEGYGEVDDG